MAIAATTVGEVRADGSDTNGGGFSSAYGGTDYTQQASPQATGTVTSSGTTVTATTGIFTSAMRGNLITDGTTWKQITAYTSSTVVTVDTAPAWTSASIKVGGAFATLNKAATVLIVSGNDIYVLSSPGVIATAANITMSNGGVRVIGYTTNRTPTNTDTKATIQAATGCTTLITLGIYSLQLINLILDGNSIAGTCAQISYSNSCTVRRCKVTGFGTYGISGSSDGYGSALDCEVTANKAGASYGIRALAWASNCVVHDLSCTGVYASLSTVTENQIYNITGSSSDGMATNFGSNILKNSLYSIGRDGIRIAGSQGGLDSSARNNVIYSAGGYGINNTGGQAAGSFQASFDANAIGGATLGARSNVTAGPNDIALTANPFIAGGSGNLALNTTAGGGALLRGTGYPGTSPTGLTVSYPDRGAVQSQAVAGGGPIIGSSIVNPAVPLAA